VVFAFVLTLLAAAPDKLVVTGTQHVDPSLKELALQLEERLGTSLSRLERLEVLTSQDVASLLGIERQRQLLGCGEESASCLTEIGAALGAPWLVTSTLARAGSKLRVDIKLLSSGKGTAVVREGGDVTVEDVSSLVEHFASQVGAIVGSEVKTVVVTRSPLPIALMIAGGLAAVGGAAGQIALHVERGEVERNAGTLPAQAIEDFNTRFVTFRALWYATIGVGVATAAAGLVLKLLEPKPIGERAWWILPTANGFAFGFSGL
jgi:TolB-like protein